MIETSILHQDVFGFSPYVFLKPAGDPPREMNTKTDTPRYLVTMYKGIGDAVMAGLSAVDQLVRHDPQAFGAIDVLCTSIQAEIFKHDPRINRIILADKSLFSSPEVTMWLEGINLDSKTSELVRFLRKRGYVAVFPGMFTPGLYFRLHAPVMNPNLFELGKIFLALRNQEDRPLSSLARGMVNRYFRKIRKSPGNPSQAESPDSIPLYISSEEVRGAIAAVRNMKECCGVSPEFARLLVVASDTASIVTRPPVALLATAIAEAMRTCPELIVCILQGHTVPQAGENLLQVLRGDFDRRVFMVPVEPRARLLDVTALIDQADVFVTGDTGLMHLAATEKRLPEGYQGEWLPRNSRNIIALFGGTNPHAYGYSKHTTILGKGRKEQLAFVPGIFKESYDPKGRNLFDHIPPEYLTEAILHHKLPLPTSTTTPA